MRRQSFWIASICIFSTLFSSQASAWYNPRQGRFLQKDPNQSAQLVIDVMAMNGAGLPVAPSAFNPRGHFTGGMNLYSYLNGDPLGGFDPIGLYDPFEEVDNWADDRAANALYTLGALNEGATLGLKVGMDVASIMLGLDVLDSVRILASGKGGFWDAMNIVVSVTPMARLGKAAGRIGKAFKYIDHAGDTVRVGNKAAKHLFRILPYRQARKLTKGFGGEIHAHHLLEKRFAEQFNVIADDIPAVILPQGLHEEVTGMLFNRIPGTRAYSKQEIWHAYQDVYRELGFDDWLNAIQGLFR